MKKEPAYIFRERLLTVHEADIRNRAYRKKDEEYEICNKARIRIENSAGLVVRTAAEDFADFLQVSMVVSVEVVTAGECSVSLMLAQSAGVDLGEYGVYRGFLIETDETGIHIVAHDERGAAQALYYLEDLMSLAGAPVMAYGRVFKKPAYSPMIVHSGYGVDDYPEEYLMRLAHEGRDAIILNVIGINQSEEREIDFNEVIERAARYGLDVYAYSHMPSEKGPEDPDAQEYYDSTYGRLFENCPGFKGVVLVGESIDFPSGDSRVGGWRRSDNQVDGIPTGKPSAGWFPCSDYPQWLEIVKKAVQKYKPEADILFWTYNWGYQPEEARLSLIENLPTDISLLVTFEMFQPVKYEHSTGFCADYTLSYEGPGNYFASEAEAAKKRGIRLYAMTNTAGQTWDIGVIPYEPMPYQWMRRLKAMHRAKEDWGLCGIMESHHYGIYPSFISKFTKLCMLEPVEDMEGILEKILKAKYGEMNHGSVDTALMCFSESIRYCTPSNGDQYGAFRVGPSYAFNLSEAIAIPKGPGQEGDMRYWSFPRYHNVSEPNQTPLSVRIHDEIKSVERMLELIREGVGHLEQAPEQNKALLELLNLGRFMEKCVVTGLHAKKWHVLLCRMNAEPTKEGLFGIYDEMEELLRCEIRNARETIPLVEQDSRLGWEPCMKYVTDRWHLEWKIRQVEYVLNYDLAEYRRCIRL